MLAVLLDLEGELALLIGGGEVALRRARTLAAAGLRLRVVAPRIAPELAALATECVERGFELSDLQGAALVVACTDNPGVNDEVAHLARRAGLLTNHAGEAGRGNLRFPAVLERAGLTIAISSGAELPLLAQALRERLASVLPEELPLGAWTQQRDAALALSGSQREEAMQVLKTQIRGAVGL